MFLLVVKGSKVGSIFPLNRGSLTVIGRGKDCDICILDIMISRKHCQIEERNNKFYIKDLNSRNKTIVNRKIIKDEQTLKINDAIEIGNTMLLFTNQKELPIKSVEDYNIIRKSQTRDMDSSPAN